MGRAASLRPQEQETASASSQRGMLLRVLGVGFGLAVIIGNTIGAGILRTPGEVASFLPTPWLFIAVWVVGGLYALLGSFAISELSCMLPRAGGYYVFARRAFGEYAGFLIGWTDWLAQTGTTAAVGLVIAEYLADFFPALAGHNVGTACAVAIFFGLLQWHGISWGSLVQNLTTLAKTIALVAFAVAAFVLTHAEPASQPVRGAMGVAGAIGVILALQAVIYSYDGWYGVMYFSEEVKEPGRDIPRAMIGGVVALTAIYVLINVALLHVLSLGGVAGENMAMGSAMRAIFGPRGDTLIRLVMIISMMSGINAYHLMASRIPYAMAKDGMLFPAVTRVNRGGTPALSLWMSVLAAVLFISGGRVFGRVAAIMAFFFVADYAMAYAALFVLRRKEPNRPRPYRAWGYPWTTGLALLGSIAFLAGAVYGDRENSVYALLTLAGSYPLYLLFRLIRSRMGRQQGVPG